MTLILQLALPDRLAIHIASVPPRPRPCSSVASTQSRPDDMPSCIYGHVSMICSRCDAPRLVHAQVSKISESHAAEQQKQTTNDGTSSRAPGPAGGLRSIDGAQARIFAICFPHVCRRFAVDLPVLHSHIFRTQEAAPTVAELATRKVASRPFDKQRRRRAAAKVAKAEEQRRVQVAAEAEAADSAKSLQVGIRLFRSLHVALCDP